MENEDYSKYGILFEAYDSEMYEKYIDVHIMDVNIRSNYGFAYIDNPIDAINSRYANIVFLAHANHWYGNWTRQMKDVCGLIIGRGKEYKPREFKRIAIKS